MADANDHVIGISVTTFAVDGVVLDPEHEATVVRAQADHRSLAARISGAARRDNGRLPKTGQLAGAEQGVLLTAAGRTRILVS